MAEAALGDKYCAAVNIYDSTTLKRRKILSCQDLGSSTIVAVAFSGDGRLCLIQGGPPEWKLVLWTADRVRQTERTVHSTWRTAQIKK